MSVYENLTLPLTMNVENLPKKKMGLAIAEVLEPWN